jgi:hypothetical protein
MALGMMVPAMFSGWLQELKRVHDYWAVALDVHHQLVVVDFGSACARDDKRGFVSCYLPVQQCHGAA